MPADDRLRLDENHRRLPARPEPREERPEQAVSGFQPGSTRLAGKDGELLSEGNILQDEVSLRSKGDGQGRAEEQKVCDQWQASVEKYCLHVGQIRSVRQPPLDTDDILPPYSALSRSEDR